MTHAAVQRASLYKPRRRSRCTAGRTPWTDSLLAGWLAALLQWLPARSVLAYYSHVYVLPASGSVAASSGLSGLSAREARA